MSSEGFLTAWAAIHNFFLTGATRASHLPRDCPPFSPTCASPKAVMSRPETGRAGRRDSSYFYSPCASFPYNLRRYRSSLYFTSRTFGAAVPVTSVLKWHSSLLHLTAKGKNAHCNQGMDQLWFGLRKPMTPVTIILRFHRQSTVSLRG